MAKQCENEMHNTGAFAAAVVFTKSKSSMLEVACLEMYICRDCERGNLCNWIVPGSFSLAAIKL